jgi:hypothetical protein
VHLGLRLGIKEANAELITIDPNQCTVAECAPYVRQNEKNSFKLSPSTD